MRPIRTLPGLAVLAFIALASPAGTATRAVVHLPAPVTIDAGAGRFQIERDGHIRRLPPRILPFPRRAAWFPGTGAWYVMRHRHLIVGQWRKTLWRSTGEYPVAFRIGVVTVGDHTVAFSYRSAGAEWLYISSLDGRERRVARNEFPLGWTTGGFYAYGYQPHRLLLRRDTGALAATVARSPSGDAYDQLTQSLYYIEHGKLMRARGAVAAPVAWLPRLGLPASRPDVELIPLGGLVELLTNGHLIMLDADGSLFAETGLPDPHGVISSQVAVAPKRSAVAYTSASGATETVYVLRHGAHAAFAVHDERVDLGVCEGQQASVQWYRRWLLFSTPEGNVSVVDSARKRPPIELTSLAGRLLGPHATFTAYWSGRPPEL